jgi:ubiquinone/menaquinone biosynthesis C-methylase UbiE
MMGTINHFSQKQRAMFFAESYRVLRPGGRLVVSAWDLACTRMHFPDWLVTNRGIYECGARLLASLVEWDQRQIERNPDCNGQMFLLTCGRAA